MEPSGTGSYLETICIRTAGNFIFHESHVNVICTPLNTLTLAPTHTLTHTHTHPHTLPHTLLHTHTHSLTHAHTPQVKEEDKAAFADLFTEVFNAVDSKQLRPFVRTQYMRTAFQVATYLSVRPAMPF
jgi:hypothetical protein